MVQDECDVYGSKLYIIVIVKSGVGSWKQGLAPLVITIVSSIAKKNSLFTQMF